MIQPRTDRLKASLAAGCGPALLGVLAAEVAAALAAAVAAAAVPRAAESES